MSGFSTGEALSDSEIRALVAECKARVRLSDVIGKTVKLKRAGREYEGLSPFTSEKTPSFKVNDEREFYHCFSSGRHGDLISWIQESQNLNWWDAFTEARKLAGLLDGALSEAQVKFRQEDNHQRRESREAYQARMLDYARRLWDASRPAEGSIVEAYLGGARAIDLRAIGGIPAALRYHPAVRNRSGETFRAMVCKVSAREGAFCGLHVTFLKNDGSGKIDAPKGGDRAAKQILGAYFGGAARLIGDLAGPAFSPRDMLSVGEGVESVLSAYQLYIETYGLSAAAGRWWAALSLGNLTGAQKRDRWDKPMFANGARRRDVGGQKPARPEGLKPLPDVERPGFLPPEGWQGGVRCLCEDDLKDDAKRGLSGTERARRAYALACAKFEHFGAVRTVNSWPPKGQDFNDILLARARENSITKSELSAAAGRVTGSNISTAREMAHGVK